MIPAVGFIVATYTIFRFLEKIIKPDTPVATRVLAVIGIIITAMLCSVLWNAGSQMPSYPR